MGVIEQQYHPLVSIPEGQIGSYSIQHVKRSPHIVLKNHLGQDLSWPHETVWHQLSSERGVWMTDLPVETSAFFEELNPIYDDVTPGAVLIGGLGLGLVTTLLAKLPQVEQIVVVEKSAEVIGLVEPHLLKDNPSRSKVTVVNADLFEYLKTDPGRFRWAHYDIWQLFGLAELLTLVEPLLQLSAGVVQHEPICWRESVMRQTAYATLWHTVQWAKYWGANKDSMAAQPNSATVEELSHVRNGDSNVSVYWNWMVPFFQRRRFTQADAYLYSQLYGLPSCCGLWQTVR